MMTKLLLALLLLLFRVQLVFSFTTNKGVVPIQKTSTSLRGSGICSFPTTTTTTTTTSTTHLCVKPPKEGDDDDEHSSAIIQPVYLMLATAETIFWYYLAPGIDPDSRWFNVATDGELISQLLNPSIVLTTQGYAYSSFLLNSFLILPSVWALLLLQEKDSQRWQCSPLPFCVAGFFVGGGALIPYMIVRKSPDKVHPNQFSSILKFFENKQAVGSSNTMATAAGPSLLVGLTMIILGTFLAHVVVDNNGSEWTAFVDRLHHSQFTSLALLDFIMLSCTIIDPISDDAKRRGYYGPVWPFLFPLVGPVAWIVQRPKYTISEQ